MDAVMAIACGALYSVVWTLHSNKPVFWILLVSSNVLLAVIRR